MDNPVRVVTSDFHFGRRGYDTDNGRLAKILASINLADFLSTSSWDDGELIVNGDLAHRPHWSGDVADRNGEGFDESLCRKQIGPLAETLRNRFKLTLVDGNCDPWNAMENPEEIARRVLQDPHSQTELTFAGLTTLQNDIFYTHGHLAEEMSMLVGSLLRSVVRLPPNKKQARVHGNRLRDTHTDPAQVIEGIQSADELGSSRFHHIVCQTLMRLERLENSLTKFLLPNQRIRRVGNETIAAVIAEAVERLKSKFAFFGHTHQPGYSKFGNVGVCNSGSATGDLHANPIGTFVLTQGGMVRHFYSYHPDNPNGVIPVPDDHLQRWSNGERGSMT